MGDVNFTNLYTSRIFVAYMRKDNACGSDCGEPWNVLGWVDLWPQQSTTRPNPTGNRWFYYYAEAVDGRTWSGNYSAEVTKSRFEKCTCIGVSVSHGPNPWYDVGMRQLDLDQFGGVNFKL